MKSHKFKPSSFDTRDLSQKMKDQEKAAQKREDKQAEIAKREAKLEAENEKEAATPTRRQYTREDIENGGDTNWKFHIEQRLSEIQNQLVHLTGLLVDRLPKQSAAANVAAKAPPALPTTNGGHPVLKDGKPALFVEVPTYETVLKYAKSYRDRHGAEALKQALNSFGVENISKLSDENKAAFLERINDEKPEGLNG